MGQYYSFANIDKKQRCDRNISMLKLMEHSYVNNKWCDDILFLLSNEWKGDCILHVGDYAEGNDESTTSDLIEEIEKENKLETTVYQFIDTFEDIKPKKFNEKIRYVYNLDKKEYIDLYTQPIQWCYLDKNQSILFTKINSFALLVACGNEQGGGDYYGVNKDMVGYWAGDKLISSSTLLKEYKDYNKLDYIFNEFLKLDSDIEELNTNTEKKILKQESKMLKQFLDNCLSYQKIDLSKVKISNRNLTDNEYQYLDNYLNKYMKMKEKETNNNKEGEIQNEIM